MHIFSLFVAVFLKPPTLPLPSLSPLLTHCDGSLEDSVEAHDWVVGIASHGSVILSIGRLVAVEGPGYSRHPFSIQHDAVVNCGKPSNRRILWKTNRLQTD